MKKIHCKFFSVLNTHRIYKLLRVMKLTIFLFFVSVFAILAENTYSQSAKISINKENADIQEILNEIENNTDYLFLYNKKTVNVNRQTTVKASDTPVSKVLNDIFEETDVVYDMVGNHIVLTSQGTKNEIVEALQQNSIRITGIITDESGEPVIGANVVEKGTTNGITTDIDGKFSLNVKKDAVLQISYIGYIPQEIRTGNETNISVQLKEDTQALEEVVVVGYGTQKKVNLTGSVISVSSEELVKRQVGQSSMLLQGIAPGVTVTQRSGQPGKDGGSIRIRGVGTLNDANPLVLVDGLEMSIDNVDPNIIESISVLKDAASSAIYGSRAANGVILITTKRANNEGFSVMLNNYAGWQKRTNVREPVNAIEHMSLLNEAYTNIGSQPLFSNETIEKYKQNMSSDPDNYPNLNWQDELYSGDGFQNNHFLTVTGGNSKMKVLAGIGYFRQNGLIPNTSYERYTARFNSDLIMSSRLSIKFDIFMRYMTTIEPGSGIDEIIYWANRMPATQPNKLTSGIRGIGWDGTNPVAMAEEGGSRKELKPSVAATGGAEFKITDYLKLDGSFSLHYVQIMGSNFNPIIKTYYPNGNKAYEKPSVTSLTENRTSTLNKDFKLLLRFDKNFGNHNIKALGGYSVETYDMDNIAAFRDNFAFPQYQVLDAGARENQRSSGRGEGWILQSVFGRINYDYASRYLFEANLRYDGSSRFAEGHKWGLFPSFSAGWRLSEEGFWEDIKPYVQNVKIRGSYGEQGNQSIGLYRFTSYLGYNTYIFGGNPTQGAALNDMANSLITWETTKSYGLGLDLATLNNKFNVTLDYYKRNTYDILMILNIPLTVGLNAPVQNAGEVENKGWEVSASYQDKIGDFNYNVGFTMSDVKNKILDMKGIKKTGLQVNLEGYPINSLYGYKAIGYVTEEDFDGNGNYLGPAQFGTLAPGDIKYENLNDDNLINAEDQTVIGSVIPRYTYGINLGMGYKGFDLSMFWQGVGKANGYLNEQSTMPFFLGGTAMEMHKDRWTPDNRNAAFPRLAFNQTNNQQQSTFWMKDASYLRLKNFQIGYTFPKSLMNKIFIQNLRVYVSGQNLLTFDKFWDGYDVEAPIGRGSFYPQVKLYSIGLDVKF